MAVRLTDRPVCGQAGITAIRRVRKSDNNRIARACGATVVNRTDELREDDVGTGAGLFEIQKVASARFGRTCVKSWMWEILNAPSTEAIFRAYAEGLYQD